MKTNCNYRINKVENFRIAMTVIVMMQASSVFATCSNPSFTKENARYQVTSDRWDPVLHQYWISVTDCNHLDRPQISRLASSTSIKNSLPYTFSDDRENNSAISDQLPLIRAGETVTVVRQENNLRIEVVGVAEQNGRFGNLVRIRLAKIGIDVAQTPKEIVAVVSGRAIVEMQP
jgi:uncharacterized lipoprotein YajG